GWSAREAECRGWSRIVTYTRADEDGTSIKAADWTKEATVRGRGWHSRRRNRSNRNGFIDKVRWGKALRPPVAKPDRRPSSNIDVSASIGQADPWLTIGGRLVDLPFGLH